MNVFIINHTTHNKGDNSVLYNLLIGINKVKPPKKLTISTSDGSKPLWMSSDNNYEFLSWFGGKMFRSPEKTLAINIIRLLKRKLNYLFIFPLIIRVSNNEKTLRILVKLFFRNFYNKIIESDVVICTGGHHISTVLEKNGINSQTIGIILVGILHPNFVLWSQSIGPLPSNKFVLSALKKSLENTTIFVRDSKSAECLNKLEINNHTITPDSVFLSYSNKPFQRKKRIIIALYTAGITNQDYLLKYKQAWIKLINQISRYEEYEINFLPMQYKGFGGDERTFIKEIINDCEIKPILIDKDLSPDESLKLIRESQLIIGHKTHSVIYALASETPIIALAYHPKTNYFMKSFGFEKFCFSDIIDNEDKIMKLIISGFSEQEEKYKSKRLSNKNQKILIERLKQVL